MLSFKLVDGLPNVRPSIFEIANINSGSRGLLLKVTQEIIGCEDIVCWAKLVAFRNGIMVHLFVNRKKLFEQCYLVSIITPAGGEDVGNKLVFGNGTRSFLL